MNAPRFISGFALLCFASCSTTSTVAPISDIEKEQIAEASEEALAPPEYEEFDWDAVGTEPLELPQSRSSQSSLGGGTLKFKGFSKQELAQIRIIPGDGQGLLTPSNATYPRVKGFFWSREPVRWFRVPSHSYVIVSPIPGKGELDCLVKSSASGKRAREANWYPNSGTTRIGVAFPFGNM